jgi:hypothetical protein
MTLYRARALFATAGSDLLTDVNAYEQCMRLREQGESISAVNKFCERVSDQSTEKREDERRHVKRISYQQAPYNLLRRYEMTSFLT